MEHNLDELADWATSYVNQLKPAAARSLARQIGMLLKRSTQKTMRAQTTPAGKAWPKRRPQDGKISRRKMFTKLATRLKVKPTAVGVTTGWSASDSRIAVVHHHGLRERGSFGGLISFDKRELIDLTPELQAQVRELILTHMAAAV